jgi:hypothetical protein
LIGARVAGLALGTVILAPGVAATFLTATCVEASLSSVVLRLLVIVAVLNLISFIVAAAVTFTTLVAIAAPVARFHVLFGLL